MFTKSTLFALAGALTLGVAMLSPVSADAKVFGGGHGGSFHSGGFKGGHISHASIIRRPGGHIGHTTIIRRPSVYIRPHWHVGYRRHYWVAPVATYAAAPVAAYAVARPAVAGPCTCLTKEYTPEGAVLFKDVCTNEAAINPPPAAPVQTGYAPAPGAPVAQ